ncbi:MAG: hypothetical protein LUC25_07920 [Ruminococcus sp.]|nr:hypothetical protein [Ruminococcus sp.]
MKIDNPFKPIRAYAWFSPTHSYIFENAFELLRLRNEKVYNELLPLKDEIASATLVPDFKGDINKGSGSHYYSPVLKNGKSDAPVSGYYKNRLGRFSKSARTMLEENITMAAIFKASGNEKMYAQSVGRAIHFIMDICCSVHTTNLVSLPFKSNPHHTYEVYANEHMNEYKLENIPDIAHIEEEYFKLPIEAFLEAAAKHSARYYKNMVSLRESEYQKALSDMLPLSFALTYIMLVRIYKFAQDFSELKIGDSFTLRSGGAYLTRKGRRVAVTGNEQSAVTFSLYERDGKLFLKAGDKFLVCEGRFGFKLSDLCDYAAVRLTKTGRGYLISCEYLNGEKYIITKGNTISTKYFDPRLNGFNWTIKSYERKT